MFFSWLRLPGHEQIRTGPSSGQCLIGPVRSEVLGSGLKTSAEMFVVLFSVEMERRADENSSQ